MIRNEHGQPIGVGIGDWSPPVFPPGEVLEGRLVRLEPLDWRRHGTELWRAFHGTPDGIWTYMTFGPFDDMSGMEETLAVMERTPGWVPYAILVDGSALGFASYLRIEPALGVIEIGSIAMSPALQRTTAATEAVYLLIRHVFDLGYRRCEWKCDSLNEPSRRAAERLGFRYEGTFAQATHYKGRNRDTAWFAIIDRDWPRLDAAFGEWLAEGNFDEDGTQKRRLEEIRP